MDSKDDKYTFIAWKSKGFSKCTYHPSYKAFSPNIKDFGYKIGIFDTTLNVKQNNGVAKNINAYIVYLDYSPRKLLNSFVLKSYLFGTTNIEKK